MNAVMISIQPRWCSMIANGSKTVEVRKTRPRLAPPFKCYIYCTVAKSEYEANELLEMHYPDGRIRKVNGKVWGEFICSAILSINPPYSGKVDGTCMAAREMYEYGQSRQLYGWCISDLKIYDEPKELGDYISGSSKLIITPDNALRWSAMQKPPQSWCYVAR